VLIYLLCMILYSDWYLILVSKWIHWLGHDVGITGKVGRNAFVVTAGKVPGILTVNNTFFFATIDKVFYYVASVLTTCFGPYIRSSSGEFTKY
jgi:hypothetical protein